MGDLDLKSLLMSLIPLSVLLVATIVGCHAHFTTADSIDVCSTTKKIQWNRRNKRQLWRPYFGPLFYQYFCFNLFLRAKQEVIYPLELTFCCLCLIVLIASIVSIILPLVTDIELPLFIVGAVAGLAVLCAGICMLTAACLAVYEKGGGELTDNKIAAGSLAIIDACLYVGGGFLGGEAK